MGKKLTEIAFFTADVGAMTDFYRRFLGQEPASSWPGGAIFMIGEVKLFIHALYEVDEKNDLPPFDHLAFTVDDVDAAADSLAAADIDVTHAPRDYYWGRSAYLRDPDGHYLEMTAGDDKA